MESIMKSYADRIDEAGDMLTEFKALRLRVFSLRNIEDIGSDSDNSLRNLETTLDNAACFIKHLITELENEKTKRIPGVKVRL